MRLPQLTFGKVLAGTAVLLVTTSGAAYAAGSTVGSFEIIDDSIKSIDIKNESILTSDILDGQVKSVDIVTGGVTASDILDGTVTSADLASNSVDSSEVVDFGLSNQDVGVLYAVVEANGLIVGSSGGVTATRLAAGVYEVDFDHSIVDCAFSATHGPGSALLGSPTEAVPEVSDHASLTDTVVVNMAGLDGNAVDAPFHLVLAC